MVETVGYPRYTLGPRAVISVNGSPFIFQNNESIPIEVFISVGTVTTIEFSRDGITFDLIGLLAGQFRLNPGDRLRVTYVVLPTMVYYPF